MSDTPKPISEWRTKLDGIQHWDEDKQQWVHELEVEELMQDYEQLEKQLTLVKATHIVDNVNLGLEIAPRGTYDKLTAKIDQLEKALIENTFGKGKNENS